MPPRGHLPRRPPQLAALGRGLSNPAVELPDPWERPRPGHTNGTYRHGGFHLKFAELVKGRQTAF